MSLGDVAVDARLLVYCDDATHTEQLLGFTLADPDPVIPEGVHVWPLARFAEGIHPWHADADYHGNTAGKGRRIRRLRDPLAGLQPLRGDSSVLPVHDAMARRDRQVDAIQRGYLRVGGRWRFACPNCGLAVRACPADFDRLVAHGYTGISLAAMQFAKRR